MGRFMEIPARNTTQSSRKLVYGIGLNDASYRVAIKSNGETLICKYYSTWTRMIERCYSPARLSKKPTYKGCTVCEEWLTFSNFKRWMESQNWKGLHLDKDIKILGNKVYGPDACLFVTGAVNSLLTNRSRDRGKWPVGVSYHKSSEKYRAQCSINGERVHLGLFNTPMEAYESYKESKKEVIIETANQPGNKHIKQFLLQHARLLV